MISLQNLEGAVLNKPDNSNTNFFNRLTKLVVWNNSISILYLAVSQSLEAVSLRILLAQLGHDGLNNITWNLSENLETKDSGKANCTE